MISLVNIANALISVRLLALFEGIPKKTGLEISLMSRFFIFQVIVRIRVSPKVLRYANIV